MSSLEVAWGVAVGRGGVLLLLGVLASAAAATADWAAWQVAHRLRWTPRSAGHLLEWTAGLASLPTSPLRGGEPLLVAVGYGVITAGAALWISLALLLLQRTPLPGGLGLFAFLPLLFALGYSLAAQGAGTPEAARRRLQTGGRILFSAPAWTITLAAWSSLTGALGPLAAARQIEHPLLGLLLTGAVVWSGLYVLPGAAGEIGMVARPWGGDAHEASRAVRAITALAHYAGLAGVCILAAVALAGALRPAGMPLAVLLALGAALALRHLAVAAPTAGWVRRGARALPLIVLLSGVALALWSGRTA